MDDSNFKKVFLNHREKMISIQIDLFKMNDTIHNICNNKNFSEQQKHLKKSILDQKLKNITNQKQNLKREFFSTYIGTEFEESLYQEAFGLLEQKYSKDIDETAAY